MQLGRNSLLSDDSMFIPKDMVSDGNAKTLGTGIQTFVTKDPKLLDQYYDIRHNVYHYEKEHGYTGLPEDIDADGFDGNSIVIVVTKNGYCIGGTRLTLSPVSDRKSVPMEWKKFSLAEAMPELKEVSYGELSRLAILPEYRTRDFIDRIVLEANIQAKTHGMDYLLAKATILRARNFQRSYRRLGLQLSIHKDVLIPCQRRTGIKRFLVAQDMHSVSMEYLESLKGNFTE